MNKLLPLALVALVFTGCGSNATDVSGVVLLDGQPVVFGTVVIIDGDGVPKSAPIQPDGTFTVVGVKPGSVKLAVSSPRPPGVVKPNEKKKTGRDEGMDERRPADANDSVSPEVAAKWKELPGRYGNPATSNLTADIEAGGELKLELKSVK